MPASKLCTNCNQDGSIVPFGNCLDSLPVTCLGGELTVPNMAGAHFLGEVTRDFGGATPMQVQTFIQEAPSINGSQTGTFRNDSCRPMRVQLVTSGGATFLLGAGTRVSEDIVVSTNIGTVNTNGGLAYGPATGAAGFQRLHDADMTQVYYLPNLLPAGATLSVIPTLRFIATTAPAFNFLSTYNLAVRVYGFPQ